MKNPFRSERLRLPSDDAFMHSVQDDPEAYALSYTSLLRAESAKASADWKLYLTEKCLLGIIISIIAPPPGDHQETTTPTPTPTPTPVPIAIISLSSARPGHEHHRSSYISIDPTKGLRRRGRGLSRGLGLSDGRAAPHRHRVLLLYGARGQKAEGGVVGMTRRVEGKKQKNGGLGVS